MMRKEYVLLIAFLSTVSVADSAMAQCCAAAGKPSAKNTEPAKSACKSGNPISKQLNTLLDRVEKAGHLRGGRQHSGAEYLCA